MKLLIDTNIFLEVLLEQDQASVSRELHPGEMESVVQEARQFNLDFDDAYQYAVATCYGLTIVSLDTDFDRTERGRRTPDRLGLG